jgi:Cu-Zn family superoxide dismutase
MKKSLLGRVFVLSVLAAAALLLPAAPGASAAASFSISPASGPPGTVISFTGTGCLPRSGPDGTFVFAGLPQGSFADQPQVNFESGPDGSFSGTIVVPAAQAPGTYGTGLGCFMEEIGWPSQPDLRPFTVTGATQPGQLPQLASALLTQADGRIVGLATFTESVQGEVRIVLNATGLGPPVPLGFTIHSVGKCDPPGFASAGPHFNPLGRKHGLQTSEGPHAGDLPNLVVGGDGRAHFDMVIARFTLSAGPLSLFDSDGSALVVHASPDDQITDPAGNAGPGIACGVIQRRQPGPPVPIGACPANPSPPDAADPSIVVDSPAPLARVTSPVTISGRARVFEATVSITIFDRTGTPIVNTFTTAAEAGPVLAPFSTSVAFNIPTEQPGCIRVFEASARDGSPVNVVQVPVTLVPGAVVQPPSTGSGGLIVE